MRISADVTLSDRAIQAMQGGHNRKCTITPAVFADVSPGRSASTTKTTAGVDVTGRRLPRSIHHRDIFSRSAKFKTFLSPTCLYNLSPTIADLLEINLVSSKL